MKLNKISMMLAAMALVGCSDDFSERFTDQTLDGSRMIELGSDFVLSGVGQEDATTRTHWGNVDGALVNQFLPIYGTPAPAINANLGNDENLVLEKVGLCWLGQVQNEKVYTNYEFYHFGWLNNGETEADVQCKKLVNGAWYTDLKLTAAGTAGDEADITKLGYVSGPGSPKDNLNLNTGVYKTDNKSIFGGDYIVYYPFNEDFKEAGTIPAIAQTKFDKAPVKYDDYALGKATFRYSGKTTINGGDQAAGFGMYNLSTLVRVNVLSDDCTDKIDQIVLFSENKQFLAQANLSAEQIVNGAKGVDLYASRVDTKTIVATLETPTGITANKTTTAKAFVTVLPTTVEDLVVLVHNSTEGKWAQANMGVTEFAAGSAQTLNVEVEQADFTADYIAVDEKSLNTALKEARETADADHLQTITVIGDIELGAASTYNINLAKDKYITIKGDAIIVPQDVTLTVKTNMESEIRVLGKSCCTGALGGRLLVQGGTISDVTMEPTDAVSNFYNNPYVEFENSVEAIVAAGKTINVKAGNVFVNDQVKYKGNLEVAEGAKVTVMSNGALQFYDAVINNYGIIEVKKDGKFNVLDASGATEAVAGKKMTNHEGAKFIHNIDASVGGATQFMNQEGEYRCKVDQQTKLDDAYQLWTACSVIEIVAGGDYNLANASDNNKHNSDYIDIEVNASTATTFTNPVISSGNGDNNIINIRNLIVKSELEVTYVTGSGKRTLNVNGYMDVQANTTLTSSNLVKVFDYLTVSGSSTLTYKKSNGNLVVVNDITVDHANFTTETDALNISCANFILKNAAVATFANRSSGKTMTVAGTISNPEGCTFTITPATSPNLIADITCYKLVEGGTFTNGSKPRVVARPQ